LLFAVSVDFLNGIKMSVYLPFSTFFCFHVFRTKTDPTLILHVILDLIHITGSQIMQLLQKKHVKISSTYNSFLKILSVKHNSFYFEHS